MSKLLCVLSVLFCFSAFGQKTRPIATIREVKVSHYEMAAAGCHVLYIPLSYGKADISTAQRRRLSLLKDKIIAAVDLVYTDYPANTDFSKLTERRMDTLARILPAIRESRTITFSKIRQTDATTRQAAENFTHGFYIYYRDPVSESTMDKDIISFRSRLGLPIDSLRALGSDFPYCTRCTYLTDTTDLQSVIPADETCIRSIIPMSEYQALKRLNPDSTYRAADYTDIVYFIHDSSLVNCATDAYIDFWMEDSTVTNVFTRNKWAQPLVVADVTGSMSPYVAQLMEWLKLKMAGNTKGQYYFFNDGDLKDDSEKKTGEVGGIYHATKNDFDGVSGSILEAMAAGSGGDAQENNIEALLKAQQSINGGDSLILIADNWAPVRDMELLSKITRPVKVIVCGVFGKIHPDYLRLARETGGSLHLLEEDIYHLAQIKEGETIIIKKHTYKLIDGVFVDVGTLSL